ncbi:hypothetical protein C0993_010114 [Termitomyces sp. T159_Od127]|nr:hypothetical protein C0993_010114 [Termitomyces sp. T159_Od127]
MSNTDLMEETTSLFEKHITKMVFYALQTKLAMQLQTSLTKVQGVLEALMAHVLHMELKSHGSGPQPSINLLKKYNRVSKSLANHFISKVKATAEFKAFCNKCQKVLWMQLYLTGSALIWSCVIMTGLDDLATNPQCFEWAAWLGDFRAAFGLHDLAQDALTRIGSLQQGLKRIMEYCTVFFKLKGKLGPVDANSKYIKDHFRKGLSTAMMEALMNIDLATMEEA